MARQKSTATLRVCNHIINFPMLSVEAKGQGGGRQPSSWAFKSGILPDQERHSALKVGKPAKGRWIGWPPDTGP
jgi:hypothetical protein